MIPLPDLLREKNLALVQLDAAKATKARRDVRTLATRAATLEADIAAYLITAGRAEDAVINLISPASCLLDGNRAAEALRIFQRATELTRLPSVRGWIANQLETIRYRQRTPGSIFTAVPALIEGNPKLRRPQLLAYLAAKSHFARTRERAIIQLPVGCGKTGTMAILPFGLARGRVLAIAPNLEISRTLQENFDYSSPSSFLRRTRVLANGAGPTCAILNADANVLDCDASDIVVANIQQLVAAKAEKWLGNFPRDYFDMILIDEGHHNVASSWQAVLEKFPAATVTSLTATPLRSDGRPVEGTRIFRFPISDAIREGFVKDIASRRLEPSEIYFEYKGSSQRHSLAEVMSLRENDWFSKGIALSPECNRNIVDASIQCLRELRDGSKVRHQIIAVACSIDHANAVRALYSERGISAEVIHSRMDEDRQATILGALRRGNLDAIVQVQILSEGADYPTLSVAAIFRPYRHLVPYVQFVGRIMRVVHEESAGHPDNRGYVVSHVGLNIDRWWEELRRVDEDDQGFFEEIAHGMREFMLEGEESAEAEASGLRRRFTPDMRVLEETIEHFVQERFLPEDARALVDDLLRAMELRGIDVTSLGVSREQLEARLVAHTERKGTLIPGFVQPQKARQEARRRLNERVRSAAKQVLNELGLKVVGFDLPRRFPGTGGTNNLATAIMLINLEVIDFLNVGPQERDQLSVEQLKRAHDAMDELVDRVAEKVRTRTES